MIVINQLVERERRELKTPPGKDLARFYVIRDSDLLVYFREGSGKLSLCTRLMGSSDIH